MIASAINNLAHAPEVVVGFVRSLIEEKFRFEGPDRRAESRRDVTVPLTVRLLDDQYQPLSAPFETVTFNLSGGGVGFLTKTPVRSNFVLIRLERESGESMELIASVRHCTRVADTYQVGARFIVKWAAEARHSPASE